MRTTVREDEDYVYWTEFEHNHRDWKYNLEYRFDKKQYYYAMALLKQEADKC